MNETVLKDEHYWERRRKNNDASKRSREKRRLNDLAMEEKIMALSAENERLRGQLHVRESAIVAPPSQPASSIIVQPENKSLFAQMPSQVLPVPLLATQPIPMLNLAQLQAVMNHQLQQPVAPFSSSTSAFQPFRPQHDPSTHRHPTVIMKAERISPDSSTTEPASIIQRVGSPPQQPSSSLLSALLSQRRPSPTIAQSRTERVSGLNSPPRAFGSSKSDCESVSSSASFSPSHSSEDHMDANGYSDKSPQYIDRRKRNNEAAKRCRANRRAVFEYRSRRVQLLEGENDELRRQIEILRREVAQFKAILAQQL